MIIPGGEAPALECDPSLQTETSIPIIKSDLPGRHVEWISLCTAEPSITVIRLQSASTLRGRWKEGKKRVERYSLHVSLQRAPRREAAGISGLSPQLIRQLKKRTKDEVLPPSRVITSRQLLKCNLLTPEGSVGVTGVAASWCLSSEWQTTTCERPPPPLTPWKSAAKQRAVCKVMNPYQAQLLPYLSARILTPPSLSSPHLIWGTKTGGGMMDGHD